MGSSLHTHPLTPMVWPVMSRPTWAPATRDKKGLISFMSRADCPAQEMRVCMEDPGRPLQRNLLATRLASGSCQGDLWGCCKKVVRGEKIHARRYQLLNPCHIECCCRLEKFTRLLWWSYSFALIHIGDILSSMTYKWGTCQAIFSKRVNLNAQICCFCINKHLYK